MYEVLSWQCAMKSNYVGDTRAVPFTHTHAQMLLNLHKRTWMDGLQLENFKDHTSNNEKIIKVRAWHSDIIQGLVLTAQCLPCACTCTDAVTSNGPLTHRQ